jgi:hypothetical protein
MADIRQAAKWMQEGKKVRRPHWYDGCLLYYHERESICILREDKVSVAQRTWITLMDLLAGDWEIAD